MAEKEIRYDEDSIRSLDWKEHIRLRPGMYICTCAMGYAHRYNMELFQGYELKLSN